MTSPQPVKINSSIGIQSIRKGTIKRLGDLGSSITNAANLISGTGKQGVFTTLENYETQVQELNKELLNLEKDDSLFRDKDYEMKETMLPDFYASTFYAQRKKFKHKYKLLTEDQISYYFEAVFLCFIQITLCVAITASGELKIINHFNEVEHPLLLQIAMFFTNSAMHYGSIAIVRNGIQMCKFVVFHYEEFTNPIEVFLLGICVIIANVYCSVINAWSSMTQNEIVLII